jgi:hypothetical protein
MTDHAAMGKELVTGAKRFIGHVVAIVAGLILMIVGVGMGVTMLLLPFGIPLGLLGLGLFLWGVFGRAGEGELRSGTVPPMNKLGKAPRSGC